MYAFFIFSPEEFVSCPCYQINDHQIIDYQIIFTANCTSRAVVVVRDN